jgi:cytochrome c oxidase cbb3-type subunit 3
VSRWCASLLVLGLLSCARERRGRPGPQGEALPAGTLQSDISPGKGLGPGAGRAAEYVGNAHALSEGKRLYSWFNCVGCHAHGGGGMGPPLMDARWIYGAAPQNIYSTIVEGRPNGMPSFQGKIPDQQLWQLVAYVRSLSGLAPKDAATGRDDQMSVRRPENITTPEPPILEPVVHP